VPLSRRQFLQMAGVTLVGAPMADFRLPERAAAYGRALVATPVHVRPDEAAAVTHHLWPDSVVAVTGRHAPWYQTTEGYIRQRDVQPILLTDPPVSARVSQPPFWGQVIGPVAPIHQWCAADAPLMTRIGHGGIARLVDFLPGETQWYGVADETGHLLGWSQAANWQPVTSEDCPLLVEIVVDQQAQRMTVKANRQPLINTAISTGLSLPPGIYPVERGHTGGLCCRGDDTTYYGVPSPLHFGDSWTLAGIYWHNQFGKPAPGPAVQTPTYVARWLYGACGPGSYVVVRN
jgi:hypothetical protein